MAPSIQFWNIVREGSDSPDWVFPSLSTSSVCPPPLLHMALPPSPAPELASNVFTLKRKICCRNVARPAMAGMSARAAGTNWPLPTLAGGPTVTWYMVPAVSGWSTRRPVTPCAGTGVSKEKVGG